MTAESVIATATVVREYSVSAAAIMTAWVAWKGLGAWKRQTTGKLRHSIVIRLIRRGLTLRSALMMLRNSEFRDRLSKAESIRAESPAELASESRAELVRLTNNVVEAFGPFRHAISQAEGLVPKKQLERGTGPLARLGAQFAVDVLAIHVSNAKPADGIHDYRPLVLSGDTLRAFEREAASARDALLREFRRHIE